MKTLRRRWCPSWCAAWLVAVPSLVSMPAAAASLTFTLAASEAVQVTGTPRIAIDVGGISGPARISAPSGVSPGVPYVATFANSVSASTRFTRINGTQIASDTTGHSVALEALSIMNNYEFNGIRNNLGQIGTVSEFVIFPSLLQATERNALESDMMQIHAPWGP